MISALRRPKPHGAALAWLQGVTDADLRISAVTIGEIQAGVEITLRQGRFAGMIAADTSALMAILLDEPDARRCIDILEAENRVLISAATVAEALIVAGRRNIADEMSQLIDGLAFEIVSVTPASARRVALAYARWGKGVHRAQLNFGDCLAYEVAREYDCALLYVGAEFGRTDVRSVL